MAALHQRAPHAWRALQTAMSKVLFRTVLSWQAAVSQIPCQRALSSSAGLAELATEKTKKEQQQPLQLRQHIKNAPNPTRGQIRPLAFKKSHPDLPPTPMADSVRKLLPLLAAQPGHYITVHIHGFPYLVQQGDQIRLPFRMPGVVPGDVLRLNCASVLGSRDFTMKGAPYIDENVFLCRATVLGTESEPMRIKIKTKRRQRREKQAKSKHRHTILCISELDIKVPEDAAEPTA